MQSLNTFKSNIKNLKGRIVTGDEQIRLLQQLQTFRNQLNSMEFRKIQYIIMTRNLDQMPPCHIKQSEQKLL